MGSNPTLSARIQNLSMRLSVLSNPRVALFQASAVGHPRILPPLRAAKRQSKIKAERTGDYSSFSIGGLHPENLMILRTVEQVRRLSRIIGGFTLLLIGIVMLVTPGPGWLVILLGLGLLAAEFVWARRLMDRIKREGQRMRSVVWPAPKNTPGKVSAESNETADVHEPV